MKFQEPKLSLLSAVSKLSSVSSTSLLVCANTKMKSQEPKLAAYNVEWFDWSAIKNKCLKHTTIKNLPDTQEGQLLFLLSKFDAYEIKTAFTDAIRNVGKAARKLFYPLPWRKEKLIKSFLELIYNGKSIMVDNSKDSFR